MRSSCPGTTGRRLRAFGLRRIGQQRFRNVRHDPRRILVYPNPCKIIRRPYNPNVHRPRYSRNGRLSAVSDRWAGGLSSTDPRYAPDGMRAVCLWQGNWACPCSDSRGPRSVSLGANFAWPKNAQNSERSRRLKPLSIAAFGSFISRKMPSTL